MIGPGLPIKPPMARPPTDVARDAARRLALAIVTHNSLSDLEAHFWGQLAVAEELGVPVVVVDNDSRDGSAEPLPSAAARSDRLTVHRSGANRGYAAGVNEAFRLAGDRDVLLLNPDIVLASVGQVVALLDVLDARADAGIVGPRLVNLDGSTQASAREFPNLLAMAARATLVGRWPRARAAAERYSRPPSPYGVTSVKWLLGAAMLVRRSAFEAVGGWDERFFLYLEDTDFCLRCREAGWDVLYAPHVALRHSHRRASDRRRGSILSSTARRHHVASTVKFFLKHPRLALGGPSSPEAVPGTPGR